MQSEIVLNAVDRARRTLESRAPLPLLKIVQAERILTEGAAIVVVIMYFELDRTWAIGGVADLTC